MNIKPLRGLYAITDSHLISDNNFNDSIKSVLQGGARLIQYRDKSYDANKRLAQTRSLRDLCYQYNALLIINDDIELAIQSEADGIHLGKNDISLSEARNRLGENFIIGISCYDQLELAIRAERQGASYVAFGAVYTSPTKPEATTVSMDTLSTAVSRLSIPICAIGGISSQNASTVIATGIDMIAVISDLFAQDDIQAHSEALSQLFM